MPSIAPSKSTTTTCVARVPYLNSVPFFRGLAWKERYGLIDCVPRELGQKAASGTVAAGLLPVADYLRLQDAFERLGHFGIAVRGRAQSVLLFSRLPIRQLDGATIAVTEETSTSAVLLRLILEEHHHLSPAAYDRVRAPGASRVDEGSAETREREAQRGQHPAADALLLIGDEALRFRRTNTQYPFEVDLAFEWWLWQHLPFVFAVWAIRKNADEKDKKQIEAGLARSLTMNLKDVEAIARDYEQPLGTPAKDLKLYLENFVYRLGPSEEEGIKVFKELSDEHHLL